MRQLFTILLLLVSITAFSQGGTQQNFTGSISTIGANNGLNKPANVIKLGGTLLENTNIELDGFDISTTGIGEIWLQNEYTSGTEGQFYSGQDVFQIAAGLEGLGHYYMRSNGIIGRSVVGDASGIGLSDDYGVFCIGDLFGLTAEALYSVAIDTIPGDATIIAQALANPGKGDANFIVNITSATDESLMDVNITAPDSFAVYDLDVLSTGNLGSIMMNVESVASSFFYGATSTGVGPTDRAVVSLIANAAASGNANVSWTILEPGLDRSLQLLDDGINISDDIAVTTYTLPWNVAADTNQVLKHTGVNLLSWEYSATGPIKTAASTAAAAADANIASGEYFTVSNGDGTSAVHRKD